jgi:methylmalonyl-CoA mutase cobalamin-binding domain/chain
VIFHQICELPEEIVKTALEEDVDAIAISASTGGHNWFCSKVMKGLKEKKRLKTMK